MDTVSKILLCLLAIQSALIIALHFFYSREIQLLLNKLMSRDYADYKRATDPIPPREQPAQPLPPPEDMSVLQNFQLP